MKIIRLVVSIAILSGFVFTLFPASTNACSCMQNGPVKAELSRSDAVFSGKVVKIIDQNKFSIIKSSADPMAVTIEIDRTWKGINQTEVVVHTERESASCGFEFLLNQDYLVYAFEDDGKLRTTICSRTAPLSAAGDDLNQLGTGQKPTEKVEIKVSPLSLVNDSMPYLYISISLIFVVLFIVVGYVFIKKRRN